MRFLVIGDSFIDKYYVGTVHRLSPEDPTVPVINIRQGLAFDGGAGLVARCLELWGHEVVRCFGEGDIVKNRVVVNKRLMHRFDFNDKCSPATREQLSEALGDNRGVFHGVLVVDYGKGTMRDATGVTSNDIDMLTVDYLRNFGRVLVHAKHNPTKYDTADVMFTNAQEYESHEEFYDDQRLLVVTSGERGAVVLERGEVVSGTTSSATKVNTTIGAGDVVMAAFAAASIVTTKDVALRVAMMAAAAGMLSEYTCYPDKKSLATVINGQSDDFVSRYLQVLDEVFPCLP